ncbi:MAG: hypothetical protein CSA38_01590 [Flavobacteriales bacterium]|nr:MAG: hypothetical protein CSA38_01590 [Flavobacteriales bacterium]
MMKKTILYLHLFLLCTGCVSQEQKDKKQIKDTVTKYWNAVKNNDLESYKHLFDDNGDFAGGIEADFHFLRKNYNEINSKNTLLENIKIKDTIVMFKQNKQKYVQYIIKKENDSNNFKKPLIITLMFYKPVGFDKIYNMAPLKNHIGWDK